MNILVQIAQNINKPQDVNNSKALLGMDSQQIEKEISSINDADIKILVNTLFPGKITVDPKIYQTLKEFQINIGYGKIPDKLIARLWIHIYSVIPNEKRKEFLRYLEDIDTMEFWEMIKIFPDFLSAINIDPNFAATWFLNIAQKISGDMAEGGFYIGIQKYAYHFPESGFTVFKNYLNNIGDEITLNLAAQILGTVRASEFLTESLKSEVDEIDDVLHNSTNERYRMCFYRSTASSFELGITSREQLDEYLEEMITRNNALECDEAFNILYRCLHAKMNDEKFIDYSIKWYLRHVSPDIPELAKYYVADSMWYLASKRKNKQIVISLKESDLLLANIQPIPMKNKDTWDRIEHYLAERIQEGEDYFERSVKTLLSSYSPQNFIEKIINNELDHLLSEINKLPTLSRFITNLITSYNHSEREIGQVFLKHSDSDSLNIELLKKIEDERIELLILSFIKNPFLGEKTSQFLLSLEKVFKSKNQELRELFKNEMIFQGINYPGVCLDTWKNAKYKSKYLKEIIFRIDQYFDRFEKTIDFSARYLTTPSYLLYLKRERKLFSEKMQSESYKHSVILQMIKKIEFIYGNKINYFSENHIGQESSFKEYKTSMEYPRMEIIDPELMIMRKISVVQRINEIERKSCVL